MTTSIHLWDDLTVAVDYYYQYDDGVRTYSNGDPGYPASEYCEIYKIYNPFTKEPVDLEDIDVEYLRRKIIAQENEDSL